MTQEMKNPGWYRLWVGDLEVTAISDGDLPAGVGALNNIEPETAKRLLTDSFVPSRHMTQTNCFVVRNGTRMALIDTGGGVQHMPATLGQLFPNMRAAGIDPAAIDTVLLTHIHPDHSYGLVDANNAATLPSAEVVLHEAEAAFWLSEDTAASAPPQAQKYIRPANEAIAPYRDRLRSFSADAEVFPGIRSMALPGHTPGHSGYLLESGGESLLIWGDIVHIPEVQLTRPEAGMAFDIDSPLAAATRARLLDQVSTDRILVAGMHISFPGFVHIERRKEGYGQVVLPWQNRF